MYGVAVDAAKNIYASDLRNPVLTVYAAGATGNVAPIRTITGANTGLQGPLGLAVDAAGELICSNFGAETVTVYAAGANGDATPVRTISGSNTALGNPYGIALDAAGKLYVVDNLSQFGGVDELTVYAAGANGNVAPLQNITGSNTGMNGAVYDAVDATGKIYVTSVTADAGSQPMPSAPISALATAIFSSATGLLAHAASVIAVAANAAIRLVRANDLSFIKLILELCEHASLKSWSLARELTWKIASRNIPASCTFVGTLAHQDYSMRLSANTPTT